MSEISLNTVENIDEVEQIILLTTCTTKLHRYYMVTLHLLDFHKHFFPKFQPPPFLLPSQDYDFNLLVVVRTCKKSNFGFMLRSRLQQMKILKQDVAKNGNGREYSLFWLSVSLSMSFEKIKKIIKTHYFSNFFIFISFIYFSGICRTLDDLCEPLYQSKWTNSKTCTWTRL